MSETVAVIGGGLVGSLQACLMAQKGYDVHLYEYRKDIRELEHVPGKSINLAMSVRGLTGLGKVGLGEHVANEYGIPMHARMIHRPDGSTYEVPYGKEGQAIFSVGRRYINEVLLTAGEKFPNLTYHFEHKMTNIDLDKAKMTFQKSDKSEVEVKADMIFGCDGAFSNVRKALMRKPWFNCSQEYIPHAYLELCIDGVEGKDGQKEFAMSANCLHIWPRGKFMMIALPNQDKSFTVTLFMPTATFDTIKDENDLLEFFKEYFLDSIDLIGRDKLIKDYFAIKPGPLVSIKCNPYNWDDKVMILGDAAHAMVPFYGQGMNCGMEDVVVLDEMMEKFKGDRLKAFQAYSTHRNPDAEAMCDLAMYNYVEMRDLVAKRSFLIRKKLDNFLHWLMPNVWIPLYTTVTFSRMRYSRCISNKKWQDELLSTLIYYATMAGGGCLTLGTSLVLYKRGVFPPAISMTASFQQLTNKIWQLLNVQTQ